LAGQPPPLVLVESRSLAGVLRDMLGEYLVPVASTNGQVGGFLHTDVAPILADGRRMIYLGDHDPQGHQIEANTRAVLGRYAALRWVRLALTDVQVREHGLPSVTKSDRRYRPARAHEAWETEALSQAVIVDLVRAPARLDELLPEPLADVRVREAEQRERVAQIHAPCREVRRAGRWSADLQIYHRHLIADQVPAARCSRIDARAMGLREIECDSGRRRPVSPRLAEGEAPRPQRS
jgi:hypothetical protein